jgi:hypothetical protein
MFDTLQMKAGLLDFFLKRSGPAQAQPIPARCRRMSLSAQKRQSVMRGPRCL